MTTRLLENQYPFAGSRYVAVAMVEKWQAKRLLFGVARFFGIAPGTKSSVVSVQEAVCQQNGRKGFSAAAAAARNIGHGSGPAGRN